MGLRDDVRTARRMFTDAARARLTIGRATKLLAGGELDVPADAGIEVLVYFADPRVNLYQIRQWYAPLAELARTRPVAILARSSGAALAMREESPVPILYARFVTDIERILAEQPARIVLYVNQNTKNFQMFRYGRRWHVFVNHGESDKVYMTSNQHKAYDYAFVAGQAAIDRLSVALWDDDLGRRLIPIGRPQADHVAGHAPYPDDGRRVILYAPTWEGDRPSAHYGSIASHGEALAAAVLASPQHRLVYRPHPRSGVLDRDYRAAHERIVAAIAAANRADPTAQHVYDDGPELGWQLAGADLAVCDVSAMIYDRLATGRPLLVTRPVDEAAEVDENGYLAVAEWMPADAAGNILQTARTLLDDPEARERTAHWSAHHFGDTTPGSATRRFHAAIEQLLEHWDEWAARTDSTER